MWIKSAGRSVHVVDLRADKNGGIGRIWMKLVNYPDWTLLPIMMYYVLHDLNIA
jgi:hypothetical protein